MYRYICDACMFVYISNHFLWIYLYYIYIFYIYIFCISGFFLLLLCFSLSSSYFLFKPSNYTITIIMGIMFINITVTGVLENQAGESSKQRVQAAWSTPIHHVK